MDNPDTGNIGYIRRSTKTNKTQHIQFLKKMSSTDSTGCSRRV